MGKLNRLVVVVALVAAHVILADAHHVPGHVCSEGEDHCDDYNYDDYNSDDYPSNPDTEYCDDYNYDDYYSDDYPSNPDTPDSVNTTVPIECTKAQTEGAFLSKANFAFTGKSLYELMKTKPEQNLIMSAFAVLTPVSTLSMYTEKDTNAELLKIMNVKTKDDIRCGFSQFLNSTKGTNRTVLTLSNKIYVTNKSKLNDSFKKDIIEVFGAAAETMDFSKPGEAADAMNKWISNSTNGKIPTAVTPDMLSAKTQIVLVNAIYFKGRWRNQFWERQTEKADFYSTSEKTKEVDMMSQSGSLYYKEDSNLDAKILELYYQDKEFSFVVILPNQKYGLLNLVEKLQDADTLDKAVNNLTLEKVKLKMPKFKIDTSIDLKEMLPKLGIKSMFSKAEVVGILNPNENLQVSTALQKATITVDEEGSEAAAVVLAVGIPGSPGSPTPIKYYDFIADHPFMYCIKSRNTLVFCGVFYG